MFSAKVDKYLLLTMSCKEKLYLRKKPSIPPIPDETRLSTTMPALQTTKRVSVVVKWWRRVKAANTRCMSTLISLGEKFCIGCMSYWWAPTWLMNYPLKTSSQSPRTWASPKWRYPSKHHFQGQFVSFREASSAMIYANNSSHAMSRYV